MEPLRIRDDLSHADRRSTAAASSSWPGSSWLTPVGRLLADQAERTRQPAQSIILLWLDGGPSQLETFDPHPDTKIAGGTKAIATAARASSSPRGSSNWPTRWARSR